MNHPTTDNPDFDVLQLDMLNPWHQFLMNHRRFNRLLGAPIAIDGSAFSYQTSKNQFRWLDPTNEYHVKLLKPSSQSEEIVVNSVFRGLPEEKRTNSTSSVLFDCCYKSPSDFAQIAQKYSAPMSPVLRLDLIFDLDINPDHPWGHLV